MWLVLVLITLILRAIVFPSTRKSFMSSAKQRVLRPKVEKINEKYKDKDNALQRQQEIQTVVFSTRREYDGRMSADAHSNAYLDCDVQLRA